MDYGPNIECDTTKIAKKSLVFCVVCINQAWKLPIAYYLINGISSDQKRNLTMQCLTAIHEAEMLITALTCDGLTSNLSMLRSLGCNFNVDSNTFQTWFKHPSNDTHVHVFLDPCHMFKLVRNSLGRAKQLLDGEDNKIQWSHFVELHKLQEGEGLHLDNKLRTRHIEYYKNKIKIKYATQLLSLSVANALKLCKDHLKLPQFKDCSGTITFTCTFNTLFDIFNSRNQRQRDFKKPIGINNYVEINQKLEECQQYIKSLSLVEKRQIIHSKLKTGFLGFLINIKSLQHMYKFLCTDTDLLVYLPTYKINQDHLELIFSNIRACGGYNNNPPAKQFKSAFKKLIIHTEIKEGNTGNCIPLSEIAILHTSSRQDPVNIINSTLNQTSHNKWLDILDTTHTDHDYTLQLSSCTSEYKNEVITYI